MKRQERRASDEDSQPEHGDEGCDWRHFGDGDPVETVHEIHEIHEPNAAEDEKRLLHSQGNGFGQNADAADEDNRGDGHDLKKKTWDRRQRADVIDGTNESKSHGGGGNDEKGQEEGGGSGEMVQSD